MENLNKIQKFTNKMQNILSKKHNLKNFPMAEKV